MSVAKSLRGIVNKIKTSIAFYPALIVLGFLGMAFFMIQFDFSESGKQLKSDLPWLSLKDASTARVIISTIVAGIISLTVFSFSMVMIVLNQAASQMSNRMLSSMIENRFQQITLGIYIGTIVYSLFLLSTIRDIHAGVYVPALSIYLLILITVTDIFLFIYFLEYVTQSVKYSNIIQRVKARTLAAMKTSYSQDHPGSAMFLTGNPVIIATWQSGYLQNIDINQIVKLASKLKLQVQVLQKKGSFLPEGIPFLAIYGKTPVDESIRNDIKEAFDFFNGQPIGLNPEYGFSHITEVAVRALSPGVNDPGTAVLCIHQLTELFIYRSRHHPPEVFRDEDEIIRVLITIRTSGELWENCMTQIWKYGKEDPLVRSAIIIMLDQLSAANANKHYADLFYGLYEKVKIQQLT